MAKLHSYSWLCFKLASLFSVSHLNCVCIPFSVLFSSLFIFPCKHHSFFATLSTLWSVLKRKGSSSANIPLSGPYLPVLPHCSDQNSSETARRVCGGGDGCVWVYACLTGLIPSCMACSKVHNICYLLKSYLHYSLSLRLTTVCNSVLMQTVTQMREEYTTKC